MRCQGNDIIKYNTNIENPRENISVLTIKAAKGRLNSHSRQISKQCLFLLSNIKPRQTEVGCANRTNVMYYQKRALFLKIQLRQPAALLGQSSLRQYMNNF